MRSAQRMLMWRRSLPPFTWLVKPSVGSRQSYNFPRYNFLWEGAELGLVDLLFKKSHWKQTNKWKAWEKTLTWRAPHGHPEKESGWNTSRKEARKTCHLLQSRTWSTLEAQNIHSEDVEKVVRSQPSESSQKKRKKNPVCKDLLLYTGFWLFSLTELETNTTNSQPFPYGFFFFLPSFVFLKTVSPAGVGNGKPFSCVLWACLPIYGFTTSPGLSWNWKPWVQHWEMKSNTKFIHFPQSNYFSPPFTHSFIHSYINLFCPQIVLWLNSWKGREFSPHMSPEPKPFFFRTHMSHRQTCTSPHVFFSPSRLSQGGFLDQAPGLLSAPTQSGSRHNLHLVVLVVSIQGYACRWWKWQVSNPFLK